MLRIAETHPMDEYIALLESSSTIFIDHDRLMSAITDVCYKADDLRALALLELRIASAGSYQSISPENILDFLEDIGIDLDKRYRNKKTKGYSLDMKKVVQPLIDDGVEVELLTTYKMYRSYKSYASALLSLGNTKKVHATTSDGRHILEYPTHIQERENLRVYYKDIAVVSIPKLYSTIITGPSEEYHLAWCDYPQADWRFAYNLFIKDETNDAIMRGCEDAYEGLARIVEGDKFDAEAFKDSRKAYKVDALSVFYNSRNNKPIPTAMRNYFRSRRRYSRYVYDLSILYQFKLPVPCTSYFGYTQLLPEAAYEDAFLSKGLNTPIQTFTSHVVNETAFGILQRFRDLGYTEEDIKLYYVRHDELVFMFTDKILKDAWVFKDCSEIHIDGFTPIKLDFHYGDFYQEEDAGLTERINREIDAHPENIHTYELGQMHEYYPVPSVESAYVQFFSGIRDGDTMSAGTTVVFYDYRTAERYTYTSSETSTMDAFYAVIDTFLTQLKNPKYLYVRNSSLDLIDSVGPEGKETLVKVVQKYDSNVASQG